MTKLLSANNISFNYPNSPALLDQFNFALNPGEFSALIGPNGAGKSTVLRILSGFLQPNQGSIELKGRPLKAYPHHDRARIMAVVPQNVFTPLPYTVREVVAMGRSSRIPKLALPAKADQQAVEHAMIQMDIQHYHDHSINNLSGGERQRAMIAMALAQEPELLLLDEPTSQLDIGHASQLMNLISNLNKTRQITVLIITHDIQLAAGYCHNLYLMKNGRITHQGPKAEVLKSDIISQTYNCPVNIVKHPTRDKLIIDFD